jgi:hypothetical protein
MRGFLPWRLSDADRPNMPRHQSCGRHPKPFTDSEVELRNRDFRFSHNRKLLDALRAMIGESVQRRRRPLHHRLDKLPQAIQSFAAPCFAETGSTTSRHTSASTVAALRRSAQDRPAAASHHRQQRGCAHGQQPSGASRFPARDASVLLPPCQPSSVSSYQWVPTSLAGNCLGNI